MLLWFLALTLFVGWFAGLNLVGLIVLSLILIMLVIGSLIGVDYRRRHKHTIYHPLHHH